MSNGPTISKTRKKLALAICTAAKLSKERLSSVPCEGFDIFTSSNIDRTGGRCPFNGF